MRLAVLDQKFSNYLSRSQNRLKRPGVVEVLESRIAPATLVTLSGGNLSVQGDSDGVGHEESLFFSVAGGYLHIGDPSHEITAAGSASADGAHGVRVPLGALTGAVAIDTGTGRDTLHFSGTLPKLAAFSVKASDASSELTFEGAVAVGDGRGQGGVIHLEAGLVKIMGSLSAASTGFGKVGGTVTSTGAQVMLNGAAVDASGAAGGGEILIGGDLHGAGALAKAKSTSVDAATVLRADATASGNGGKIVVWSDFQTDYAGTLSARGAGSGAGGAAEVSGKALLHFIGVAILTAPSGQSGNLLLDPDFINIVAGGSGTISGGLVAFGDTPTTSSISPATLSSALQSSNVTLQANVDITFTGNATLTGTNTLTLQAGHSIDFGSGAISLAGALTATAHDLGGSGFANPTPAISSTGSIAGAGALSFTNAGGNIRLHTLTAIGFSVTTNGTTTTLDGIIQAGSLSVMGPLTLSANVTTANAQSYGDNVTIAATTAMAATNGAVTVSGFTTLNAGLTVNAGTGNVKFTGKIDGANALTVNSTGTTTFGSPIGGVTPLSSLTTNAGGTTSIAGNITSSGALTFNDNVTIDAMSTLTPGGATKITFNQALALNSALTVSGGSGGAQFTGTINGPQGLAVTASGGQITLGTLNGAATPLASLSLSSSQNNLNGASITTTGNQTYTGTTVLGTNVALTSTNNGDIAFGAIRAATTFSQGLTVSSGATGHVNFNGMIGTGGQLASLSVTGAAPILFAASVGPVSTFNNQTYTGPLTLSGAGNFMSNQGSVTFGKIDGATSLTASAFQGKITLGGEVGSTTPLQSVFFSTPITINTDLVKTTNGQTWGAALTLAATTTLQNAGGAMTFSTVNATTDGGQGLKVLYSGTTTEVDFLGAIGNLHPLANLSVTAPLFARISGNISTTGDQTYSTPVILTTSLTFTTKDAKIGFGSKVDSASAGQPQSLTLATGSGSLAFGGAIGSGNRLQNLTTTSGVSALALPGLTLIGSLSVTTDGGDISQNGPASVFATSTFTAGAGGLDLSQTGNDFTGQVFLSNKGAHNVSIADAKRLVFGSSSLGTGTLKVNAMTVTQLGPIVQAAGAGLVTITTQGAGLTNTKNDFTGAVSFVLTGGAFPFGSAQVTTSHGLTLEHSTLGAGSLTAMALGGDLNVVGEIDMAGGVDLTSSGTESAVILSSSLVSSTNGARDISIEAAGDIVLRQGAGILGTGVRHVTLTSDNEGTHSGAILVEAGSIIQGDFVTLYGGSFGDAAAFGSGHTYDQISLNAGVTILGGLEAGIGAVRIEGHGNPTGAGAGNFGVLVDGGGAVTATGFFPISIEAIAGAGSAALAAGPVFGTGIARLGDAGTGTFTGSVSLVLQEIDAATDSIALTGATIQSTGSLDVRPVGPTTSIGLGGAAGTLNLSTAELASFADGFSSINIGFMPGNSVLTANAATFSDPVKLNASGGIILNGTVSAGADNVFLDAGSGTITLNAPATFTLKSSGLIADASKLNVNGGTLDLGAFDETVAGVTLTAGSIAAAGGTLTAGAFELQSGEVHAALAGLTTAVGVLKTTAGTVSLSAPSTYAGGTTISAGTIEFSHPQALGTGDVTLNDAATANQDTALLATAVMNDENIPGGTQGPFNNAVVVAAFGAGKTTIGTTAVSGGATLLVGTLTLNHPVTLQGENDTTTSFGEITGAAGLLTIAGGQRVTLGDNSYSFTGDVKIVGGGTMLEVGGIGETLPDSGSVDVGAGATLLLGIYGTHSETIGALTGAGAVQNGFPDTAQMLVVGGGDASGDFSGMIIDGGPAAVTLVKTGSGTQTLSGTNTYTGSTLVQAGKLALVSTASNNNIATSATIEVSAGATLDVTGLDHGAVLDTLVLASGQKLRGGGTIAGHVTAQTNTNVSPITDAGTAILSTGDITLNSGSTLAIAVNGPAAGSQHGELSVTGAVALNDATLSLTGQIGSDPFQQIVLIQNDGADPVSGTFHGLPEGSPVTLNGVKFVLSYHGGDGNDVTLGQGRAIYVVAPAVASSVHAAPETVKVYDAATGGVLFSIQPYEAKYRDSIRVAVADLNGDGFDDIITTTGKGTGRLRVFDGLTGQQFTSGPFSSEIAVFNGRTDKGAFVATGDLTGDGHADLIVSSSTGGGKVRVFDGATGAPLTFFNRTGLFQPFGATFRGGLRVSAGDVNGDGYSDLVVGQNSLGATVQVYSGLDLFKSTPGTTPTPAPAPLLNFKFGAASYRGGVNVATADLDADGKADLIVGNNTGKATQIQAFGGVPPVSARLPVALGSTILPFGPTYAKGVNVAALDINGDGIADIIAANGGSAKSVVNIYSGADHSVLLRTFNAFPDLPTAGLFIAASAPVRAAR